MSDEDIIDDLLKIPFSRRAFEEKKSLISKGRPMPALPNLTQQQKNVTRHFQTTNYERCEWLAGSVKNNRLFCWTCLLFSCDRSSTWSTTGYSKLNNLTKAIRDHDVAIAHIRASIALATFGTVRIETELSDQTRQSIILHNEKVKRNRDILKRLINAVCFLAKQELSFRGDDESKTSNNRGNYLELLDYTAQYDPLLKDHLENSTVFKGVSNRIQNDLIESVASALNKEIKQQLDKSDFFAILADETTDVANKSQFSLVYRYANEGRVVERFVCFQDVSEDKTAAALSNLILSHIQTFSNCGEKLIAQSYDGSAVMASSLHGVQANIKEYFPHALFVHCYAHCLNLALSQSASSISECRIFFATLTGLAAFFSKSPKRSKYLDEFLGRRLPHVCPTRWNYSSRLVNTIHEKKEELRLVFVTMLEHQSEIENDILAVVQGHLSNLENFEFCFLLATFHSIFSLTDVLFNVLQNASLDIAYCRKKITETQNTVNFLRNRFQEVYEETVADVGLPGKRNRNLSVDLTTKYRRLYFEIFDNIEQHINTRFQDYGKLTFLGLLDYSKYSSYVRSFPTDGLKSLLENYGRYFDEVRLKNELIVAYSSNEFSDKSPFQLMKMLATSALGKSMPQLHLLATLISVIPVSTSTVERSFSALKRIKTHARNRTGQKRLSNLGLISIESELLNALKERDTFFDSVIEHFATSDRRIDFIYK